MHVHGCFEKLGDAVTTSHAVTLTLRRFAVLAAVSLAVFASALSTRGAHAAEFDYYLLALSWAPNYCATNQNGASSPECTVGSHFGFVLHGLWPQANSGQYLNDCPGNRFIPADVLASTNDLYPSRGLAIHEWQKHGLCSGLSAADYFGAARAARGKVRIPDALAAITQSQTLAPEAILQLFFKANSGLDTTNTALSCPYGNLSEIRICLAKDLSTPTPCPKVVSATCRAKTVAVLPPI